MNSIIKGLLFFSILLLGLSCNSSIGLGSSYNKGNLYLDTDREKEQRVGFFVEYKWQHMFDRNGIGVDYNSSYRGYTASFKDGTDLIIQNIQLKYYYTLVQPRYNHIRLDLSAGIGIGRTIGHFYFFVIGPSGTPPALLSNISTDIYFTETQLIYISPKLGYITSLGDATFNLSFELSAGIYFGGKK